VDIVVPALGESVTEATVAKWFKNVGDHVEVDEPLVELETDKVAVEVNAQSAGVLDEIVASSGAEVGVGAVLGRIAEGASTGKAPAKAAAAAQAAPVPAQQAPQAVKAAAPSAPPQPTQAMPLAPAVRKMVEENKLDPNTIPASGKDGRLTKEDVLEFMNTSKVGAQPQAKGIEVKAPEARAPEARQPPPPPQPPTPPSQPGAREERVKMTRLRRRIAERLKEAQNTAAMLTTFNEVDMTSIMKLRGQYRDAFEKRHGIKLGFMGFFVKACVQALKEIPEVNGEIQGDELVYKNYYNVGVAVGTEQGLVVPVVRDADQMNLAEIEKAIASLGRKARDGKLTMEDLTGGTFTISNGGVYGSLMSMPILNPPQSGILGMHKIQDRPVAVDGQVQIRPMMYLALSYDHRIVDGREAVTFLVRVKELIEDPSRIVLDV
jgi:2-oxoglutarate dehydrogenase E2 component (dihydrolipoamide succinyltransferase)